MTTSPTDFDSALRAGALRLGLALPEAFFTGAKRYVDTLLFWNRKISLTAVREPLEIAEKHFVDSLTALPHVPSDARSLVDVGSGPGFPGAVLALARPELAVTLVESNHKKAAFLQALRRDIPLPNLTVAADRFEAFVDAPAFQPFDVAISRATWDVLEWLPRGAALVKPTGRVLAMEGSEIHELPSAAARTAYTIAGAPRSIISIRGSDVPRGTS